MKKIITTIALIFLICGHSLCSISPEAAKWENFTDLKSVSTISVDNSQPYAYCGSAGGLFIVNLSTGSVLKKFTNLDGLINVNITTTIVDNNNNVWVGASDGSICIYNYRNNSWKYIYDIKYSSENDKTIYNFTRYGNYIYVATGYGIQKISMNNFNFVDAPYYQLGTFQIKTKVFSLAILNDTLYAATSSGIASANLINSNLNNPTSWGNPVLPINSIYRTIEAFDNKIFAGCDLGFIYYNGFAWLPFPNPNVASIKTKFIKSVSNRLYFINNDNVYSSHKDSLSISSLYYSGDVCNTLSEDNNHSPLVGVYEKGLLVNNNNALSNIYPNCPNRSFFLDVKFDSDGNIWGCSGLGDGGFYRYDGKNWFTYTNVLYPALGVSNDFRRTYSHNNVVYSLGWGNGVALITGTSNITLFTPSNSPLPGIPSYPNYCVPTGGAFDNNGYFWCSFYGSDNGKCLYVYMGDTNWIGFLNSATVTNSNFEAIAIDNYNTKWVVSGESAPRGLYYFNENGTINNPNDDVTGFYSLSDFSVNDITFVTTDRNGSVWITTNNGVFVIDNPDAAIRNPNNKPAPQKIGLISGNLKVPFTENCNTIYVDVLNQKWIGTDNNGVFHLSDDGTTLIEQFNTSNSPILDNKINSIVVNEKDGKAYFATQYGLSSVQTNAVEPVKDFDKIICKPNPFLVPPTTELKIDGLVENSSIKIITLNGEVVSEFPTSGGRIATWNGMDKKGKYVPSGIYIIVAFNKDGSKVGKGKVVIVRK